MSSVISYESGEEHGFFWLKYLPLSVLDHIGSFLYGDNALAFGECFLNGVLSSERRFWKKLKFKELVF